MKCAAGKKRKKGIAYISGDSYIHALDPRTKLLVLIVISILSLFATHIPVMALLLSFVVVMALMSGIFDKWVLSMRLFLPLLMFILLIDAFFTANTSGHVFIAAELGFLTARMTTDSILFAFMMCLRLITIGGMSFLFIMTTPYGAFVKSLRSMRLPRTFSFSLGYALRSTTLLSRDACNIMDAQRSRGLEFDRNSVLKNRNAILSLFIPMAVSVMKRSEHVSNAMQCRGFLSDSAPTMYRPLHPGINDAGFLIITLVFTALILALSSTLGGP
jgi:energy-coupling factor transport system permease protein